MSDANTGMKLWNGADILVQCLVNHGVDVIFAYPGGASMPMHQALTALQRQAPHHPAAARAGRRLRGRGLRPQPPARSASAWPPAGPGRPTSSPAWPTPRWTRVPIIAITGQVGTHVIGTDAFQETPIVEVCRAITKHHYLVHADRGHRRGS